MSNLVPVGVSKSFWEMIWGRSILLLVYRGGARSDVTVGLWKAVEKRGPRSTQIITMLQCLRDHDPLLGQWIQE
jgi:hypothetical protein